MAALSLPVKIVHADEPIITAQSTNIQDASHVHEPKKIETQTFMPLTPVTQTIPVNILDILIDEAKKQINTVSILLAGLSSMVHDNQIAVINKKETLHAIKALTTLVHSFQREKFVNLNLATTLFLLKFNSALIDHLITAINNNLNDIKPFDPTSLISKSLDTKVTIKAIEQCINENKKKLQKLVNKADHAGLHWYNIAYRKADKWVISPSVKYSIPQRTLLASACAAVGLTSLWYISPRTMEAMMPSVYNTVYGEHPRIELHDGVEVTVNEDNLKPFGRLENFASKLHRSILPITAMIGYFAFQGLKKEWDGIAPRLTQQIQSFHHWLLGGSHLKQANKLNNLVDKVTFDDLVGLDHVKNEFKLLVHYLANPEPYDRLGLTPPKGILLDGPTRTGKSHSVKALYNEIQSVFGADKNNMFKFIPLDAPTINREGIGYLLSLIKKHAPCVVFIDEIDLLDLQRKGKNETLSEFLTMMSGYLDNHDSKNQVIIIAATNRPENLDIALRQPGRFGKELHFEYPSYQDRTTYIEHKLNKMSLDISQFSVNRMARETEGQSYEALNILINNAVLKARMRGQAVIQEHIDATFDDELRHIIQHNNKMIPAAEREILAVHFAGHALATLLMNSSIKLAKITIKDVMVNPKEEAMGIHLFRPELEEKKDNKRLEHGAIFTYKEDDSVGIMTQEEKRKAIMFHLAGIAAEEILHSSCGHSCHTVDMKSALDIAQSLVFEGLNKEIIKTLPETLQNDRFKGVFSLINECKQEVKSLLLAHKDQLTAIAQELAIQETLSAQDIQDVLNPSTEQDNETKEHITE
jgi:cell division protease FtsH